MESFWAKELTKYEIFEGNLKTILDCQKYYESLLNKIPSAKLTMPLEKRFDIDLPDIKQRILEVIPELIDQLGRNPNYHQIANELEIKKDLAVEILDDMASSNLIEKIKVGKGFNYTIPNSKNYPPEIRGQTDILNLPLEEKDRMLASCIQELGIEDNADTFNPYPKKDLGKLSNKNPLGDKQDEIKRMMIALNLSAGQKMELSLKFKNQPETLRDYLERQIMQLPINSDNL